MTDTLFPDISEFQPDADIAGIRKATAAISARVLYGITPDKMMPYRIGAIRGQKFDAVMWYIFMRPPQTGPSVAQQFAAVRNILPELLPGEAICVDWESDTNKVTPSANDRDCLLTMLDNYYGEKEPLYAAGSALAGYAPNGRVVWAASYGVSTEPKVTHNVWQYTDGRYNSAGYAPVSWPGCGFCDTSVFHGTSKELAALLSTKVHLRMQLNRPVAGILATPTGKGYWLYAQDGGLFAFGDAAVFSNPVPAHQLAAPVIGGVATPTGQGIWLTAADGGVFCFGDAEFFGSVPGLPAT